eukprot:Skav234318  [mRNA]  locus=scaffold3847:24161:32648:- [translate_table: standard]
MLALDTSWRTSEIRFSGANAGYPPWFAASSSAGHPSPRFKAHQHPPVFPRGGTDFPRALLSDFGTAQAFGEPPASATAAASRGYTGTVEYTAPELLFTEDFKRPECEVTAFVDVDVHFADASSWLPFDAGGRIGPLRLVLAALLALDAQRRPATTDLLENPVDQTSRAAEQSDHRSAASWQRPVEQQQQEIQSLQHALHHLTDQQQHSVPAVPATLPPEPPAESPVELTGARRR